ncbi:FAD-dependent oxidoreductase [Aquicella lusitana]|uniref:Sarcosine oxidase/L-pipecolate oxidase n=1 Tax=Aquicella lusitana TaxID=254246 RepID=A0A370G2X4_9COXI|nr:FAD-dependent oxidoreductase [Aquicella lusitana]RDI37590.1 sarcosine oxidase/L-pipecolate oxidase [Aquicella lusitana]VVC73899.1 Monomeric sarcosine oxidase [Aquicella lusitana]
MMNAKKIGMYDADVIVIGGGPIGLASAFYAAKMGQSVIVLEQFSFGNQAGSSAGHVRMWRTAITEASHAKMAFQAGDMYREIERESGQRLLHPHGLLNFGVETEYTAQGTIETAYEVLKSLGHRCIKYTKKQLEERFPFKDLPDNYYGVYHENNAVIDVKLLLKTLVSLNAKYGVALNENEPVTEVKADANGVMVKSTTNTYFAKKVIVTPGPYINEFVGQFGFQLNILFWEMAFAYYKITDPSLTFPMWFQFDYKDESVPTKLFYGFPPVKFGREGFVRLAVDWASHTFTEIGERKYVPRDIDIHITQEYVKKHMRGVSPAPIDMAAAVHPQIVDNLSVLDFMPEKFVPHHQNIVLFTGGWAFKFVPLFGKMCADLAVNGGTEHDISELAINRKGVIKN